MFQFIERIILKKTHAKESRNQSTTSKFCLSPMREDILKNFVDSLVSFINLSTSSSASFFEIVSTLLVPYIGRRQVWTSKTLDGK